MQYKRIIVFDFDNTLCFTPEPDQGKKIWKEKTREDWPHIGWWSKTDSLNIDIFDIPVNKWIYKKYLEAVSDPDNYVMLATGRLLKKEGMLDNVMKILNKHNLSFDEVQLNWGGSTLLFKLTLFENKIKKLGVEELIMYDDRHISSFIEWANKQDIKIAVIDSVTKNKTKNKKYI
jgi:hypothetical protein